MHWKMIVIFTHDEGYWHIPRLIHGYLVVIPFDFCVGVVCWARDLQLISVGTRCIHGFGSGSPREIQLAIQLDTISRPPGGVFVLGAPLCLVLFAGGSLEAERAWLIVVSETTESCSG